MKKEHVSSPAFHFLHWDINIVEFYIFETLLKISTSIISLFIPIYLLVDVGYSISEVMAFFVLLQLFFFFTIAFGGKVSTVLGTKKTMALKLPFTAIYYYGLQQLGGNFYQDLILLIPLLIFYSTFSGWSNVARDIFLSKHVLQKNTGKMLAFLKICMVVASVISPLAGGWISYIYGFDMLFWCGTVLVLLSGIPLFLTPDEHFEIKYKPRDLFSFIREKVDKSYLMAEAGNIFSDVIMWIMWPLFLYFAIKNTAEMGTLVTASAFVSMGVAYFVGQKINGKDAKKLLKNGIKGASFLFFLRAVSLNPFAIGAIDAFNKIIEPIYRIPYDRAAYRMIMYHQNQIKMANLKQLISETYYTSGVIILWVASLFVESESKYFFISLFAGAAILMLLMQQIAKVKFQRVDEKFIEKEEHHGTATEELKVMEEGELRG